MPEAKTLNERDTKLVSWLNEAHNKEAELEADLTAHISLTQKPAYKKRLQQHLKETRDHKRRVAQRIKQLGGSTGSQGLVGATSSAVGEVAGKTVAAVKGQVGVARALVTEQAETHLRNAQEELREEHVEIAIYTRIETFATAVGDRDTAQLARSIRRDEERMAKFLAAELERLVKDVVRAEVPRDQRATSRSRSRRSSSTSRSRTSSRASSSGSRSRTTSSRSSSSRSSGSRNTGSRSTGSRSSGSRSTGSRSSGSRSASSRSSGSRSTSSRSSGGSTRSSGARSASGRSSGGSTRSSGGSTRSSRSRASTRS